MIFMSEEIKSHIKSAKLNFYWKNFLFILFFHVVALVGVPLYYGFNEFHWGPVLTAFTLYWLTGFGITMGYHRLWSHKTYKASPLIEWPLLLLGAMALQNSALRWCSDHRRHHQFTDTPKDPYSIKLGLWWAHILWIFFDPKEKVPHDPKLSYKDNLKREFPNVADLIQKRSIRFQHWMGQPGGLVLSLGLPGLLGYFVGDFWGYFLVAGFLRIAMVYQSTFMINSLAHLLGEQSHSKKDSSRDSFICALVSMGEGYHNFHHTYPNDFRNGPRFYHFDPTKWLIAFFSLVGLTWDLRTQGKTL